MKINKEKTETTRISRSSGLLNIKVEDNMLRQVKEFKYLGSIFTDDGKMDSEIENRCQKANAVTYQLAPLLKHKGINMNIKRQLINSIFQTTLCYQSQTWTLTKSHKAKIEVCEMRCLRRAANISIRDRVRNEDIRKIVGTTPCMNYIERQKVKWFGHLVRMHPDQLPLRAYNGRRSGTRARGRPRCRWIDNISDILGKQGLTTTEASQLAMERKLQFPTTLCSKSGTDNR